ncbi:auxin response factor 2A-like [Bidens hawaiensis]|uniref:auxin response factor 2A-like n=1 Tax=Bidens hawaiensis TaxID=980011 RepID=UPI00404ABAA7
MKQEDIDRIPNHGLPSKILCKVVDVQLKAVVKSEEVYAKITLRPNFDECEASDIRTVPQKVPASFFRKVLRATDVSTDGGCGLPRKDAENTFPPLDMTQDTASQDIVAKDLHGLTWKFQHTYRRSQNRHTLINGWGKFVREKKLCEGDACVFLRWKKDIYIGVRRAARWDITPTVLACDSMQLGVLYDVNLSIKKRNEFTVSYYPWTRTSPFIVAYDEVMESSSSSSSYSNCITFLQTNANSFTRFLGTISIKEDIDSEKWPQSEWQCLKVHWDPGTYGDIILPERVCPWQIRCVDVAAPHQRSSVYIDQEGSMPLQPVTHELPFLRTDGQGNETLSLLNVNTPGSSTQDQPEDEKDGHKLKLFGVYIG